MTPQKKSAKQKPIILRRKEEIKTIALILSTIIAICSPIITLLIATKNSKSNFEMLARNIESQGKEHSKDVKLEIIKIIKEMYIGHSASEQKIVIDLLSSSLGTDFSEIRSVLINSAIDNSVKEKITNVSDKSITTKEQYDQLKQMETNAIKLLANENLWKARDELVKIYEIMPNYHNVYEIINEILNIPKLEVFGVLPAEDRIVVINDIKKAIVLKYNWGLSKEDMANLQYF